MNTLVIVLIAAVVLVCAYAGYTFVKLRRVCYDEYVVKLRFKLLYIVFKYVFFIDRQELFVKAHARRSAA